MRPEVTSQIEVTAELYDIIQEAADESGLAIAVWVRRAVKLGLVAQRLSRDPNSAIIICEGGRERDLDY